jgi:hypothetical protein
LVHCSKERIMRIRSLFLTLLLTLAALAPAGSALAQSAERITFPPGATSVNMAGNLDNGAVKQYILRAIAGQTMTVGAAYVAYPYQVSVLAPNSQILGVAAAGSSWSGTLPSTGDYYLIVQPGVSNARVFYNFVLSITGSTSPTATPRPPTPAPPNVERIKFAPGAVSATVYGTLYPSQQRQYVLAAQARQSMTVQTSSSGPFRLVISGADGTNLGTIDANQSLTVYLPRTQDYYLVLVPTSSAAVNYTLQVTIVGNTPPPTATPVPPPQAQRISFAPGAVSATVSGYADASRPASYVLRAMAGQDMTVQIYGSGRYNATLTGKDGSYLGSANSQGTIYARLPRTQDYYITISVPNGAPPFNFSMVVTVVGSGSQPPTPPPSTQRITFAPGAVSATVYGATAQNYVLKALRGQTMYVELFTNGAPAQARIENANGQLLGTADQNYGWSGVLPGTQDYYIRVTGPTGGASTSFTLRVTIY